MEPKRKISERSLKVVSLGAIFTPFVYSLVIYISWKNGTTALEVSPRAELLTKIFFALSFILIVAFIFMKNKLWDFLRKKIVSEETFYQALLRMFMLTMMAWQTIGVFGLVLFFQTGRMQQSLWLLAVSVAGMVMNYPSSERIANKRNEFNFPNNAGV